MPVPVPSMTKVMLPLTGVTVAVLRVFVPPVVVMTGFVPPTETMSAMSAPVLTAKVAGVVAGSMALLRKVRAVPVPWMLVAFTSVIR